MGEMLVLSGGPMRKNKLFLSMFLISIAILLITSCQKNNQKEKIKLYGFIPGGMRQTQPSLIYTDGLMKAMFWMK